jgi:hypothetical protein
VNPAWLRALALLSGAFGIATVLSGGRVLFGPDSVRVAAGRVVPFVLWFNFLAGFAYLATAAGLWRGRRWAAPLALGIAAATGVVFLAFGIHALRGGAFEPRTVAAMTLRTAFWAAVAAAAWRRLRPGGAAAEDEPPPRGS